MSRIKVGVIGCGAIAQIQHLPHLKELRDEFEIAAISDISAELLAAVGAEFGVPPERQYLDYHDLVDSELDAVIVCSSGSHAGPSIAAARAGKHVLVEKPMCTTVREAQEMVAAADASGVVLMVANLYGDDGTRVDTDSWASVPVFAAATLPILWRRRNMIAVLGVTLVALGVHVAAFGWMVRCGAGLPLSLALAYGAGRLLRGRDSWVGLGLTMAVQVLVLVKDSAAGLEIIPVTAAVAAAAWGAGMFLQRRSEPVRTPSYDDRVATRV